MQQQQQPNSTLLTVPPTPPNTPDERKKESVDPISEDYDGVESECSELKKAHKKSWMARYLRFRPTFMLYDKEASLSGIYHEVADKEMNPFRGMGVEHVKPFWKSFIDVHDWSKDKSAKILPDGRSKRRARRIAKENPIIATDSSKTYKDKVRAILEKYINTPCVTQEEIQETAFKIIKLFDECHDKKGKKIQVEEEEEEEEASGESDEFLDAIFGEDDK